MKRLLLSGILVLFLGFLVFNQFGKTLVPKTQAGLLVVNSSNSNAPEDNNFQLCSGFALVIDDPASMPYSQTLGYITANHEQVEFKIKIDNFGNFSGFAYSQTSGWINMTGVKANCESGELTGNAYGQLIGYVNFNTGTPKIQQDGKFTGYAYSQTAGWMSLTGWMVEESKRLEIRSVSANPASLKADAFPNATTEITAVIDQDITTASPPFKYEADCNGNFNFDDDPASAKLPSTDSYSGTVSCSIGSFDDLPKTILVKVSSLTNPEASDSKLVNIYPLVDCYWDACQNGTCVENGYSEPSIVKNCPATPSNAGPGVKLCTSNEQCASRGTNWTEIAP